MPTEVFMPKMSDHMEAGEIVHWLAQEGDSVEKGQVLLEVMTDKVTAEIVAEAAGVLKGVRAGADMGAVIPVGETMAFIAEMNEEVPKLPPIEAGSLITGQPQPEVLSPPPETEEKTVPPGGVRATPVARRIAKELGIDLNQIRGSGPGGRIRETDVVAYGQDHDAQMREPPTAARATPAARRAARELGIDITQVQGSGPGQRVREQDILAYLEDTPATRFPSDESSDVEWFDLTSIQRLAGQRMLESVQTVPQFHLTMNADATHLVWLRQALMDRIAADTGERLSVTALLIKIAGAALRHHPHANAVFSNGRLRVNAHINVGVAVGASDGLVVPVIRDADKKSLQEVVRDLTNYTRKAQEKRLTAEDLAEGTFTLSNLGMYGVDRFNAIINPPQSAILAVGRIIKTPVGLPNDTIELRPMMSLTLTADHRSIDGIQAARFLAELKERVEEPFFLL